MPGEGGNELEKLFQFKLLGCTLADLPQDLANNRFIKWAYNPESFNVVLFKADYDYHANRGELVGRKSDMATGLYDKKGGLLTNDEYLKAQQKQLLLSALKQFLH